MKGDVPMGSVHQSKEMLLSGIERDNDEIGTA
jgi:hypothetical protein